MGAKKTAAKTSEGLNLKQEEFCQLFIGKNTDLFGNGTQAYLEVYGLMDELGKRKITYEAAMAASSRLLSNVKVLKRINELLETGGFNDENVDKQHLFLINQHADKKVKLGAIAEYNKLKSRITRKLDITSAGKALGKFEQLSNEQLAKLAAGSAEGDSEEDFSEA